MNTRALLLVFAVARSHSLLHILTGREGAMYPKSDDLLLAGSLSLLLLLCGRRTDRVRQAAVVRAVAAICYAEGKEANLELEKRHVGLARPSSTGL